MRVLDENREIVQQICKEYTGWYYRELDAMVEKDKQLIFDLFRLASIIRYLRNGVKITWIEQAEIKQAQYFLEKIKADES